MTQPSNPVLMRTRLLSNLEAIEPGGLTLLISGPGYGKSTLLAQWAAWSSRTVCLVRLDEADNSADGLGGAVARALVGVLPGAADILELAHRAGTDWTCDVLPQLIEIARGSSIVLVLDDVHEIRDASARELLRGLARTWPSPNSMVLSGRERPAVGLIRSTIGAPLIVIGESDLNLDVAELTNLLDLAQVAPTTVGAQDLLERTGGWPAGVGFALAAVDLEAGGIASRASSTAARYLEEHVVAAFSGDEIEFLELVAAMAPAPTELVDRTLNRNDTRDVIQMFLTRGLPMVSIDGPSSVVRVHSLLADLLRERMWIERPERMHTVLVQAAHTAIAQADIALGLTLLHRSGDLDELSRTLYSVAPVIEHTRETTVRSWVEQFPAEAATTDPRLVLASLFGMQPMFEGEVRALVALLEGGDQALLPDGGTPTVVARRMMIAFGFDPATDVDGPVNEHWTRGRALAVAFQHYAEGHFDEARRELATLEDNGLHPSFVDAQQLAMLGILASESGQVDDAVAHIERARRHLELLPNHSGLLTLIIDAAILRMARLSGRWTLAQEASTAVRVKQAALGDAKQLRQCWANVELANLSLDLGEDPTTARRLRDEANRILGKWPGASHLRSLVVALSQRIGATTAVGPSSALPQRRGASLSSAEMRLLRFLPSHFSLPSIATQLNLASSTVKSQSISVYRKLGVNGREDAVRVARDLGLLADMSGARNR